MLFFTAIWLVDKTLLNTKLRINSQNNADKTYSGDGCKGLFKLLREMMNVTPLLTNAKSEWRGGVTSGPRVLQLSASASLLSEQNIIDKIFSNCWINLKLLISQNNLTVLYNHKQINRENAICFEKQKNKKTLTTGGGGEGLCAAALVLAFPLEEAARFRFI